MKDETTRRAKMIETVNETIVQSGFASLTMDKIAHIMGVSRAKLYKYFSSKDDVVAAVVDRYFQFMDQQRLPSTNTPEEFVDSFMKTLLQLITLVASSSNEFRTDLARTMPDCAQKFDQRYADWMNNLKSFITKGKELGVFNANIVPELFFIQTEATIPALMNNERLAQYQLDVYSLLSDYLDMMVSQIISPAWQSRIDISMYQEEINNLTVKHQQTLIRM